MKTHSVATLPDPFEVSESVRGSIKVDLFVVLLSLYRDVSWKKNRPSMLLVTDFSSNSRLAYPKDTMMVFQMNESRVLTQDCVFMTSCHHQIAQKIGAVLKERFHIDFDEQDVQKSDISKFGVLAKISFTVKEFRGFLEGSCYNVDILSESDISMLKERDPQMKQLFLRIHEQTDEKWQKCVFSKLEDDLRDEPAAKKPKVELTNLLFSGGFSQNHDTFSQWPSMQPSNGILARACSSPTAEQRELMEECLVSTTSISKLVESAEDCLNQTFSVEGYIVGMVPYQQDMVLIGKPYKSTPVPLDIKLIVSSAKQPPFSLSENSLELTFESDAAILEFLGYQEVEEAYVDNKVIHKKLQKLLKSLELQSITLHRKQIRKFNYNETVWISQNLSLDKMC